MQVEVGYGQKTNPYKVFFITLIIALSLSGNLYLLTQRGNAEIKEKAVFPSDFIKRGDIMKINENRWCVDLPNQTYMYAFSDTGSMLPVLHETHNSLGITLFSEKDIFVGDIIAFSSDEGEIVHRVIDIGYDDEGWYATTKGDALYYSDPQKIRFDKIMSKMVVIFY